MQTTKQGTILKTTKTDVFSVDPRNIIVENTFNERNSDNYGNIPELALNITQLGLLVPLIGFRNNGKETFTLIFWSSQT